MKLTNEEKAENPAEHHFTVYEALWITSSMTGNNFYILSQSREKIEEAKKAFYEYLEAGEVSEYFCAIGENPDYILIEDSIYDLEHTSIEGSDCDCIHTYEDGKSYTVNRNMITIASRF